MSKEDDLENMGVEIQKSLARAAILTGSPFAYDGWQVIPLNQRPSFQEKLDQGEFDNLMKNL